MFARDQPLIARHARTPEGFADVVTFVIATQNQHFHRVSHILDELRLHGLGAAPYLTGSQKRGIAFIRQHAAYVVETLDIFYTGAYQRDDVRALRLLVELPSIGTVKAGFVLQLVYGRVGCLDRHNLQAAGLALRAFQKLPQSTEALTTRLHVYVQACAALGTPEGLWNGWCGLIAGKYPQHFDSAEAVSQAHVDCIVNQRG